MKDQMPHTLVNLQNGHSVFRILTFENGNQFSQLQRNNHYTLIWMKEGRGKVKVDFAEYDIEGNNILAFSPYQPFVFSNANIEGTAIYFHPDFFCIHKHQTEGPCIFSNTYQLPYTYVNDKTSATLLSFLLEQMKAEVKNAKPDHYDILVSYLKIFLITTARLKNEHQPRSMASVSDLKKPFILQTLVETIEKHYREKHAASDYAKTLNISAKALAKITKDHFNKTLTEMISERIVMEAKRELYLSTKSVKEIAYELGYEDEHYFSRFFKTNADVSPQIYRETVGFGRGGFNGHNKFSKAKVIRHF